jgi:hypothetical protein
MVRAGARAPRPWAMPYGQALAPQSVTIALTADKETVDEDVMSNVSSSVAVADPVQVLTVGVITYAATGSVGKPTCEVPVLPAPVRYTLISKFVAAGVPPEALNITSTIWT